MTPLQRSWGHDPGIQDVPALHLPVDDDWFKVPLLFGYFLLPALLVGEPHFTLWLPHPVTAIGWILFVAFYVSLSFVTAGGYTLLSELQARRNRT